ncbi:MAG: PepSY domain-containing protein [Culicoidibacterales bacterium]
MLKNKQILLLIGGLILSSIIAVKASEPEVVMQAVISQEEAIDIAQKVVNDVDLEVTEVYFETHNQTKAKYLKDGEWAEILQAKGAEDEAERASYIIRTENTQYKYIIEINAYTGKVIGLEKLAKSMSR